MATAVFSDTIKGHPVRQHENLFVSKYPSFRDPALADQCSYNLTDSNSAPQQA